MCTELKHALLEASFLEVLKTRFDGALIKLVQQSTEEGLEPWNQGAFPTQAILWPFVFCDS